MPYRLISTRKKRQRIYAKQRKVDRRLRVIELMGGQCVRCACVDVSVLQMDHVDPWTKDERATDVLTWGWVRLLGVLWKFQLLCADCHVERGQVEGHFNMKRYVSRSEAIRDEWIKDKLAERAGEQVPDWVTDENY